MLPNDQNKVQESIWMAISWMFQTCWSFCSYLKAFCWLSKKNQLIVELWKKHESFFFIRNNLFIVIPMDQLEADNKDSSIDIKDTEVLIKLQVIWPFSWPLPTLFQQDPYFELDFLADFLKPIASVYLLINLCRASKS